MCGHKHSPISGYKVTYYKWKSLDAVDLEHCKYKKRTATDVYVKKTRWMCAECLANHAWKTRDKIVVTKRRYYK